MRTGLRRRLLLVPAVLALAAGLTGCSMGGGSGQRTATALFNDVGDLANGAQVQLADVPVGSVSSIALEWQQGRGHADLRQQRPDSRRRQRRHRAHHHPR